ncbi:MAG: N,N-dimethylformamidase beta subunit family domain-containing protein, partial [Solirubrobacteraceae bacterium]
MTQRLRFGGLILAAVLTFVAAVPAVSQAAPCDPPVTNPVACENTLPGDAPSTWEIDGAGDPTIQGFATQMSVNKGTTVNFKIKSATTNYRIDILRLGWYGGNGARRVATNVAHTGSTQPACLTNTTGLVDCGNWSTSGSWAVPSTAVSGVYLAYLKRNDTGGTSHIVFVVRDDASTAPVMLQTSDATWHAYNTYGGNSLYQCTTANCPNLNPSTYYAALKVSYNRPFNTAEDDSGRSWLFSGAEYPMIRFLERSGYNTTYTSQVDTEARASLIRNHKLFISSGHDEYWSKNQRDNVTAARDAGVNLAFFSGNEMFWKTRYESSIDGSATANRTLVSYKDTHFEAQQDPVAWTGTWRDPRFTTAPNRPTPENALTGQSFIVNSGTSAITVPFAYKNLRLWRNTTVTSLSSGQSATLGASTLGYEWDVDADNGFRPAGQFRLSSTTVSGLELFTDYGSHTATGGTATHNLTAYRVPSGALVFGAGTVQWSWGLDDYNPLGTAPNLIQQQATVNLFADMDAQPTTLPAGLVAATKSTDTTKPTSTITAPAAGANLTDGQSVTISGTASDSGGVVAGVEVSTDGGSTWHPATTGTSSWTYTWSVHGSPSTTIKTRASDDSGNTETPGAGRTVNVACPCSIFGNVAPPAADSGDTTGAELGVKFTTEQYGTVSGVRFYKSAANSGTHVGSLWSADGTRLAQATFSNESSSGWQSVTFSSPVQVLPNTTYIASYHAPNGRFAATPEYFYPNPAPGPNGGSVSDAPPLHAVRNSGTTTNGMFAYSTTSTFPA